MARRSTLPIPNGWYFVATAQQIQPNEIITRKLAQHEIVLYRTNSQQLHAFDAYCPHLGAHLGKGGTIEPDGCLRCPFHGFCFDAEGNCTRTEYGHKAPPKAQLRRWHTAQIADLVMVWYHANAEPPTWHIPPLDSSEYSRLKTISWKLRSHPQEITENSVDVGHFTAVHGYEQVQVLQAAQTKGACLYARYGMARKADFLGNSQRRIQAQFTAQAWGLGFSVVDVLVSELNLISRQFVLPTPTSKGNIRLTVAMQMKPIDNFSGIHPLLNYLPKRWINEIMLWAGFRAYYTDVAADFHIWNNKTYIERPPIAKGDGPIPLYRKWVQQFYSHSHETQATLV